MKESFLVQEEEKEEMKFSEESKSDGGAKLYYPQLE
jgi:hypothetical protein